MDRKTTVGKVLEEVDSLKPNGIEEERKRRWIFELEIQLEDFRAGFEEEEPCRKRIWIKKVEPDEDQIKKEEPETGCKRKEEEEFTDETVLSVPAPYCDVYRYYLESKIDYANGEIEKYNNSRAMYNNALSEYENDYRRKHMPKGEKLRLY